MRVLLLEFLGLLEAPDEFEAGLLTEYFEKPDYQATVLMSIAKSAGWFARTHEQYLSSLMNQPEEVPGLNFLLQKAITFARDEVLRMMTSIWLANLKKDYQVIAAMRSLYDWNEDAVRIAEIILERTDVVSISVCTIADSAQNAVPEYAARLIKAAVGRQIMLAQEEQRN
ncbi:MAG: hypothetical protein K2X81_01500 [Candidatus Obscuribacterales bacterium]|nr:hypothetical protein [Candidatus Obscuribacterales bacterium]